MSNIVKYKGKGLPGRGAIDSALWFWNVACTSSWRKGIGGLWQWRHPPHFTRKAQRLRAISGTASPPLSYIYTDVARSKKAPSVWSGTAFTFRSVIILANKLAEITNGTRDLATRFQLSFKKFQGFGSQTYQRGGCIVLERVESGACLKDHCDLLRVSRGPDFSDKLSLHTQLSWLTNILLNFQLIFVQFSLILQKALKGFYVWSDKLKYYLYKALSVLNEKHAFHTFEIDTLEGQVKDGLTNHPK